jgi:flagellar protein FlaF
MAVAEIIGAAVGVMLLIIVAYVLVGSVLTTAEVVTNAQKDVTLLQGTRLGTSISLNPTDIDFSPGTELNFSVTNSGNVVITDFAHMDLFVDNSGFQHVSYSTSCGTLNTWCKVAIDPDVIHPNQLDPGEKMWVLATLSGTQLNWFQITTSNGVNAQTTYP